MRNNLRYSLVVQRVWIAASYCLIAVHCAPAPNESPPPSDGTGATNQLLNEYREALDSAVPFEVHGTLATRLGITPMRAQAITIGPQALGNIQQGIPASLDFHCGGGVCVCSGDRDCNDMFSTICRDPGTDGSCTDLGGGRVVCTCSYR
jgi:hypothetical protein